MHSDSPKLVLDTNAWVDYFIDRGVHNKAMCSLVAAESVDAVQLFTPVCELRDIAYLVGVTLKTMETSSAGPVSNAQAAAINEVSWACLEAVCDHSSLIPATEADFAVAKSLRPVHSDIEDNFVAAAVIRSGAAALVTSDKQLLARQPVPCITPEEAVALVE